MNKTPKNYGKSSSDTNNSTIIRVHENQKGKFDERQIVKETIVKHFLASRPDRYDSE